MTSRPTGDRGYCRRCTMGVWFVEELPHQTEATRCVVCGVTFSSGKRPRLGQTVRIYALTDDADRFCPSPIIVKPGALIP